MGERRIKTKVRTKVLIEIIFDGYDISEIRDKYATFELGKLEDEKKRIGIYKGWVHADIDETLDQQVMWVGK